MTARLSRSFRRRRGRLSNAAHREAGDSELRGDRPASSGCRAVGRHRAAIGLASVVVPASEVRDMAQLRLVEHWSPLALSILRVVVGLLFLEHGTQKILDFPPALHPGPALLSLQGVQGIIELVGGVLILLGLFTRAAAFILSGDMAVAYFMAHAPKDFFPMMNGGDAAILYCFAFLYLVFAGGGRWSIDEAVRRATSRR